jgi:hypothetical protein
MIVTMQEGATEQQIQNVIEHLVSLGFSVHRSTGERHTVLGAVGARNDFDKSSTASTSFTASARLTSSLPGISVRRAPSSSCRTI